MTADPLTGSGINRLRYMLGVSHVFTTLINHTHINRWTSLLTKLSSTAGTLSQPQTAEVQPKVSLGGGIKSV